MYGIKLELSVWTEQGQTFVVDRDGFRTINQLTLDELTLLRHQIEADTGFLRKLAAKKFNDPLLQIKLFLEEKYAIKPALHFFTKLN